MKLQRVALSLFLVIVVFYLLHIGQKLIQPIVIAGVIAYLINILSHAIRAIRFGGFRMHRLLAKLLAIAIILASLSLLVQLVTVNIQNVIRIAPELQGNLEQRIYDGYELFGVEQEEAPDLREFLSQIDVGQYLQNFGRTVQNIVSRTGIIFVYLVFLLIEFRTFKSKLKAIFPDRTQQSEIFEIIKRISRDVRLYIGIKVLTSAATGLLSYLVLRALGVNFASFWAVLIFALNFIPTIGSIIATIFPSAMALVQFETLGPVIAVVISITLIQLVIGSFIDPKLMGNKLNLSPMVILFSLGLWGAIWGIPGMFLCVPFTVIIMIICSYFPATRAIAVVLSGNGKLTVGRASEAAAEVSD